MASNRSPDDWIIGVFKWLGCLVIVALTIAFGIGALIATAWKVWSR